MKITDPRWILSSSNGLTDEPQDRSLAALLASLADDGSPPASQAAAGEVNILEEKDSILLEKPVVPDDETSQRDDAETLEMSQVVWEEGSQDKAEDGERWGSGVCVMLTTWSIYIEIMFVSKEWNM